MVIGGRIATKTITPRIGGRKEETRNASMKRTIGLQPSRLQYSSSQPPTRPLAQMQSDTLKHSVLSSVVSIPSGILGHSIEETDAEVQSENPVVPARNKKVGLSFVQFG